MKFYDIATALARPLQYKNCYNWALVAEIENEVVYFISQSTIVKSTRQEAIDLHNQVTRSKPQRIKLRNESKLWGHQYSILMYAIENNLETQHYNFMEEKWQEVLKKGRKFSEVVK